MEVLQFKHILEPNQFSSFSFDLKESFFPSNELSIIM